MKAPNERQMAAVRLWRLTHPGYHRAWREKFKLWRDSEPNARGGSRPRTKANKLAYEINVSQPLQPEERANYGLTKT